MANAISVVLREDVEKLGKAGDLVRVKPGFARNFLVPQGLGTPATRGNIQEVERQRASALARAAKKRLEADGLASAFAELLLPIEMAAGEGGRLFGAVTAKDVATALESKGHPVDRRKIVMPAEPLKMVGEYTLQIKLGSGVLGSLRVDVRAKA